MENQFTTEFNETVEVFEKNGQSELSTEIQKFSEDLKQLLETTKTLSLEEENILKDIFHHKHTKVTAGFKQRMKELRAIVDESEYSRVLETKELTSLESIICYAFLSSDFRNFIQLIIKTIDVALKKKNENIEECISLLTFIAKSLNTKNEFKKALQLVCKVLTNFEEYDPKIFDIPVCEVNVNKFYPKSFVETWIGEEYTLDKLFYQILDFKNCSKEDPKLKEIFLKWKIWMNETSKQLQNVNEKISFTQNTEILLQESRLILLSPPYYDKTCNLRRELNFIGICIKREDNLNDIRSTISNLANQVIFTNNGDIAPSNDLYTDATVIANFIIDSIAYLPLPRIHRKSGKTELILDNLIVKTRDIIPSSLNVDLYSDDKNQKHLFISISGIEAHLSNVDFIFRKESKLLSRNLTGIADINISGMDLSVHLLPRVLTMGKKVLSLFEVTRASCSLSKLKIHMRETPHDKFYKLLAPLINHFAAKKLEEYISEYLALYISKLNAVAAERANKYISSDALKIEYKDDVPHISLSSLTLRNFNKT